MVDSTLPAAQALDLRSLITPTEHGIASRVLAKHGCRTTDHFAGFQITGRFQSAELVALMAVIPRGSTELMVHPGYCGPALRAAPTRLKESREAELAALVSPDVRAAMSRAGIELVNYAGLG